MSECSLPMYNMYIVHLRSMLWWCFPVCFCIEFFHWIVLFGDRMQNIYANKLNQFISLFGEHRLRVRQRCVDRHQIKLKPIDFIKKFFYCILSDQWENIPCTKLRLFRKNKYLIWIVPKSSSVLKIMFETYSDPISCKFSCRRSYKSQVYRRSSLFLKNLYLKFTIYFLI